jgi:hypothetical protein
LKITTNLFHLDQSKTAEAGRSREGKPGVLELPEARGDALRLAGQLCAGRTNRSSPLTLLFSATTAGLSASRLIYETGLALLHLNEAPVLLIDLCGSDGALVRICARSIRLDSILKHPPWSVEGLPSFALACLSGPETDPVTTVGSERFASFLELAKKRFSCILLDTGPVAESVVSLLVSAQCDGVVLCVKPGKSTLTEVQDAKTAFARANAKVLGFVFDEIS